MKSSKKRLIVATSLVAGICVFAGAVFANYSASNGYSVYKKALINMIGLQNYTLEVSGSASIDGEVFSSGVSRELYAAEGDVNLNQSSTTYDVMGGEYGDEMYFQDGVRYQIWRNSEGVHTSIYDGNDDYYTRRDPVDFSTLAGGMTGDEDTDSRMIRFMELLADTLVGDIKNNFVYLSGDENSSKYQLQLDSVQIPELFNAGLSAMFSAGNADMEEYADDETYYQQNPMVLLGRDPIVKSVKSIFDVDKNGLLTNNVLSIELEGTDQNGVKHTVSFEAEINLSDVGTTQPQRIDPETLENIEYRESVDRRQQEVTIETTADGATYVITESEE